MKNIYFRSKHLMQQQTVEQTIETPVVWDDIPLIMTSL